ncbi:hypothetical protein M426DRAFT_211040 [Hypoxylon sp. CI-4A]|nr:hypothetical protein M426DRAFT_211040 [Hypoxylon sp. CI-4A]
MFRRKPKKQPSRTSETSQAQEDPPDTEPTQPRLTFVFVVNEVQVLHKYAYSKYDLWNNCIPPDFPFGYTRENPGTVFRFHNGSVFPAPEYVWAPQKLGERRGHVGFYKRPVVDQGGYIHREFVPLKDYSTRSVFDCGPFLPCIFAHADVTCEYLQSNESPRNRWFALEFKHRGDGVSEVTFNGGKKYVAGKNASWVGPLVPRVFENPELPCVEQSRGLGGDLGVILGLMALAEPPGQQDDAFRYHWNHYRWMGQMRERPSELYRHAYLRSCVRTDRACRVIA